ncbi:hypothetical protein B0O99DRAFT_674379 [Bisporella sp. PMI_857]|nr:hypothetical protein B0O99DRAFT_674379 [Bisporella sp. PMI_857]
MSGRKALAIGDAEPDLSAPKASLPPASNHCFGEKPTQDPIATSSKSLAGARPLRREGLDWLVFHIAGIPGRCDEKSWPKNREDGEAFEDWVGENGWSTSSKSCWVAAGRELVARLVDTITYADREDRRYQL